MHSYERLCNGLPVHLSFCIIHPRKWWTVFDKISYLRVFTSGVVGWRRSSSRVHEAQTVLCFSQKRLITQKSSRPTWRNWTPLRFTDRVRGAVSLGSNLGHDTWLKFFVVFLSPSMQMSGCICQLCLGRFIGFELLYHSTPGDTGHV
jgi:hypothetical protein